MVTAVDRLDVVPGVEAVAGTEASDREIRRMWNPEYEASIDLFSHLV